jgi:hypothetical protein
MKPDDVTNCQRCQSSLERGHSARWEGDKCVEVVCFKCSEDEEFNEYLKDKTLTSHLFMNNNSKLFYLLTASREPRRIEIDDRQAMTELKSRIDIQLSYLDIKSRIKEFERRVWFSGLQDIIRAASVKGVSAKPKSTVNFCVLTYSMCGRTMFTIEDDLASVTLITDETSKESCMGLQGIRANVGYAKYLINLAIEMWESQELKFVEDTKVGIF